MVAQKAKIVYLSRQTKHFSEIENSDELSELTNNAMMQWRIGQTEMHTSNRNFSETNKKMKINTMTNFRQVIL